MNNYDNLLRKKEEELQIDDSNMKMHWAALQSTFDSNNINPPKRGKLRNLFKIFIATTIIAVVALLGINKYKKAKHNKSNIVIENKAIKPLLDSVDIRYETFAINNELGDTLFTQNGSILIFPKNAIVDKSGNVVKGKITIKSREFNDPIDFAFAGIPMTYDSAGVQYNFISSGMIDINAYQNGEVLFVNPNAKPIMNLVSTSNAPSNLYQLNTNSGQWKNKGNVDVVDITLKEETKVKNQQKYTKPAFVAIAKVGTKVDKSKGSFEYFEIEKPIPPHKASGTNPIIEIQIDPTSFKELLVYNNMKFEVIGGDIWNPKDSDIEWDNVQLQTIAKGTTYKVTFTKGARKVSYVTNPVLEGYDYDHAVSEYDKKLAAYEAEINEVKNGWNNNVKDVAIQNENIVSKNNAVAKNRDSIIIENTKVEQMNKLIALRNEYIARRNVEIEEQNKFFIEQQKRYKIYLDSLIKQNEIANAEAQKKVAEEKRKIAEETRKMDSIENTFDTKVDLNVLNTRLIRSFQIDNFGVWNCDQPIQENEVPITVNYRNGDNKNINIPITYLLNRSVNSVITTYNNQLRYNRNEKTLVFGAYVGAIVYNVIDANKQMPKDETNQNFNLPMQNLKVKTNSFKEIKKALINKLNGN